MEKGVMANTDIKPPVKDRFPRMVIVILLTAFCKHFSFSGMRVLLTIYLQSKLGFSDEDATEAYHVFFTFVFIFPIIGGIVADNFLGKFRTILYMIFVFAAGNLLLTLTAIPLLGIPGSIFLGSLNKIGGEPIAGPRIAGSAGFLTMFFFTVELVIYVILCTIIGLFFIAVGTGGLKPCVLAFGGDQFKLPEQEHHLDVYFNMLSFAASIAGLLAKTISPILRSEIHCFGEKDCYSLAFGAPTVLIIIFIVTFLSAKNKYLIKKLEGNIVFDLVKCVSLGIKNRLLKRNRTNRDDAHWLDSTRHQYDPRFIRDIKKTLSILVIFAMVPMFWALIDQMGSRWTQQATRTDGRFGLITIKPDQVQVFNPIFALLLIPLIQKYFNPFLDKRNLLQNPLHKMALGGFIMAISFILSGVVEIYLKTTYPLLPQPGGGQLRVFNGYGCPMSVYDDQHLLTIIPSLTRFSKKDFQINGFKNVTWRLEGNCFDSTNQTFLLEEKTAISYFMIENGGFHRFKDAVDKSISGLPIVTFLVSAHNTTNMTFYNDAMKVIETPIYDGVSQRIEVFSSTYSIRIGDEIKRHNIEVENGAVYKIMINNNHEFTSHVVTVTAPNSITMAWLMPQLFLITIGETLFVINGNEFTFKEAPESMKALMTSIWMLTEACGNVIIIIITRLFAEYQQETQSFIYSGLLLAAIGEFLYLARGYQFGTDENFEREQHMSDSGATYLQVKQTEE